MAIHAGLVAAFLIVGHVAIIFGMMDRWYLAMLAGTGCINQMRAEFVTTKVANVVRAS